MPHNSNKQHENVTINIHQKWELEYWSQELVASTFRLLDAINTVGTNVSDVKQYLSK